MSNHLPPALKARALHAAHAVTLGALMLTGCPKTNTIVDDAPKKSVSISESGLDSATLEDASGDAPSDTSSDTASDAVADAATSTTESSVDEAKSKCDLTTPDDICPPSCSPREDADCCIASRCRYNSRAKSCGCTIPGPFRAPEMPV